MKIKFISCLFFTFFNSFCFDLFDSLEKQINEYRETFSNDSSSSSSLLMPQNEQGSLPSRHSSRLRSQKSIKYDYKEVSETSSDTLEVNRLAAKKHRLKKNKHMSELENSRESLIIQNAVLEGKETRLKDEIEYLKSALVLALPGLGWNANKQSI